MKGKGVKDPSGEVRYYLEKADGTRQLLYCAGIYAGNEVETKNMAFYMRFLLKRFFD